MNKNMNKNIDQNPYSLPYQLFPIALAIFLSLLLIGYDVEKAFAQAVITVITPTGSASLTSASDCLDISAGNDVIWLNCNSILYALDDSTNTVIANITDSSLTNHQACQLGTCVLAQDNILNDMVKYNLEGSTIVQTARWSAPCAIDADTEFDDAGFMWFTCSATDQIVRFNPAAFTTHTVAGTNLLLNCVNPDHVTYDSLDNIGFVHCTNGGAADVIISFTRATDTSITILDSEVTTTGTIALMVDGIHNRLLAPTPASMFTWTYTSGGIMTLGQTLTGNSLDRCAIEPFNIISDQSLFALCIAGTSPEVTISGFMSNSTGLFTVFNGATAYTDSGGIGLDLNDGEDSNVIWYISANTNNQKYIRLNALRAVVDATPNPPLLGEEDTLTNPDMVGGINCALPINAQTLLCRVAGDPEPPNIVGGVDCSLPANIQTVLCRTGGSDKGNIGGAGDYVVGDGAEGTGVTGILCSLGFVDCAVNPDLKTNGLGYLMFIGGIALMMGLFLFISKGNLIAIPVFIWIIGILALAGAMALFNIIDPVIFIITIVAVVALAVPKIVSTIRGDQTLGAGNTS